MNTASKIAGKLVISSALAMTVFIMAVMSSALTGMGTATSDNFAVSYITAS